MNIYQNPNRVVVDVYKAVSALPKSEYPLDSGGNTTKIRIGNHDDYMRIVFDVKSVPKYQAELSEDKTKLHVTLMLPDSSGSPRERPLVVIDAGHGGSDPGALGKKDGQIVLKEKDINLAVSLKVIDILKANSVDVLATRTTDEYVSLSDRTDMANRACAALFVSIHCNAYPNGDISGSLVMHHTTKDTTLTYGVSGEQLATNILKYLPGALGTVNRGRVKGDSMWVIRNSQMPAVIVEMAFITNEGDRAKLSDPIYQAKAAEAIAKGILDTLPSVKLSN